MACPGSAEIVLQLRDSWFSSDATRSVGSGGRSSHSVCLCLLGWVLCCHITGLGGRRWMDRFAGGGSWEVWWGWGRGACFPLNDVSGLNKFLISCLCFRVFCSIYLYVFVWFVVFIHMFSGVL